MIYRHDTMEQNAVLQTAALMCAAARTAPKTHGTDRIQTLVLTGEEKDALAQRMGEIAERGLGDRVETWYGRDAANVRAAQAVVLIGAGKKPVGLPACGFCGFGDCGGCKKAGATCAFAYVDLGIAADSAALAAVDSRADNRIMFSIGRAAEELDLLPGCLCLGIPVSVSGKSVFFDRSAAFK